MQVQDNFLVWSHMEYEKNNSGFSLTSIYSVKMDDEQMVLHIPPIMTPD